MKRAFLCLSILALVGCSNPASVCKPASCPLGSATYQASVQAGGNIVYTFGASTCTCNLGDTVGCMQCSQEIANYCAGGPGSGANGDGGTSGSGDCAPRGGTTSKFVFDSLLLPQQGS